MNCPFCQAKLESNQDQGVMFAHPVNTSSGCPMAGDYHYTVIWEKYQDAVAFMKGRESVQLRVAS